MAALILKKLVMFQNLLKGQRCLGSIPTNTNYSNILQLHFRPASPQTPQDKQNLTHIAKKSLMFLFISPTFLKIT